MAGVPVRFTAGTVAMPDIDGDSSGVATGFVGAPSSGFPVVTTGDSSRRVPAGLADISTSGAESNSGAGSEPCVSMSTLPSASASTSESLGCASLRAAAGDALFPPPAPPASVPVSDADADVCPSAAAPEPVALVSPPLLTASRAALPPAPLALTSAGAATGAAAAVAVVPTAPPDAFASGSSLSELRSIVSISAPDARLPAAVPRGRDVRGFLRVGVKFAKRASCSPKSTTGGEERALLPLPLPLLLRLLLLLLLLL